MSPRFHIDELDGEWLVIDDEGLIHCVVADEDEAATLAEMLSEESE